LSECYNLGKSEEITGFFNLPNPSSRTEDPEFTQPLTEMSTKNLPAGKGRLALEDGNFTAICESTV
jgi:hypothetical protein